MVFFEEAVGGDFARDVAAVAIQSSRGRRRVRGRCPLCYQRKDAFKEKELVLDVRVCNVMQEDRCQSIGGGAK